jgi:hypothetical protein
LYHIKHKKIETRKRKRREGRRSQAQKEIYLNGEDLRKKEKERRREKYKRKGRNRGERNNTWIFQLYSIDVSWYIFEFADWWENIRTEWSIKEALEISRKDLNKCVMLVTHCDRV